VCIDVCVRTYIDACMRQHDVCMDTHMNGYIQIQTAYRYTHNDIYTCTYTR